MITRVLLVVTHVQHVLTSGQMCFTRGQLRSLLFNLWTCKLTKILKLLTIVAKLSIFNLRGSWGASAMSCRDNQKKAGTFENQKQF